MRTERLFCFAGGLVREWTSLIAGIGRNGHR
jgi:hypothetical protein